MPAKRTLLTESILTGDDGGQMRKYLVNDPQLNEIAQGIGLLVCPSKDELPVRPGTLRAFALGIYPRLPTEKYCLNCIDPFLDACSDVPCFYTAIRKVTWPRTAFLIGENLVVTARHSLPIGLHARDEGEGVDRDLEDIRVIFGLTYDKLRGLMKDGGAGIDIDNQSVCTVARYKPGTYKPGPSGRYDWATFQIEVITPKRRGRARGARNQPPLKPAKALERGFGWLSKAAQDGETEHDLAILGHPLGLSLTLVQNKSTLSKVLPPGVDGRSQGLPKGHLLAAIDSIDGYSGAPVLTQVGQKWEIVGLCVGTARNEAAADPAVRACALSGGDVVDRGGNGRARILPAEFFFFKKKASKKKASKKKPSKRKASK